MNQDLPPDCRLSAQRHLDPLRNCIRNFEGTSITHMVRYCRFQSNNDAGGTMVARVWVRQIAVCDDLVRVIKCLH